jgi:hypothetical protein
MKLTNSVKIDLEGFDKCSFICEADTPIGRLFDFSCALQAFFIQKIKENEPK